MQSIELLNNLLQNEIPEFDGTIENRHTFIKNGDIVRWIDKPYPENVELIVLRKATSRELQIWENYQQLVKALYLKEED